MKPLKPWRIELGVRGARIQSAGNVACMRGRRLLMASAALVAMLMLATTTACGRGGGSASSAPGGFGTGGKVLTHFGSSRDDEASAVAIQADGKIVAAGYSDSNYSDSNDSRDFPLA